MVPIRWGTISASDSARGQGCADLVEPFEVEALLIDLLLAANRAHCFALELEPDQGGGGGDHSDREHRGQDIGDRLGRAKCEGDERDRAHDHDSHQGMSPPGEEKPGHGGEAEQDRLGGRRELGDYGQGSDPDDEPDQPSEWRPMARREWP